MCTEIDKHCEIGHQKLLMSSIETENQLSDCGSTIKRISISQSNRLKIMIVREQENIFLFEFGLIVPAVLKCLFCIISADVVHQPGEKLSIFTRFCSNQRFS